MIVGAVVGNLADRRTGERLVSRVGWRLLVNDDQTRDGRVGAAYSRPRRPDVGRRVPVAEGAGGMGRNTATRLSSTVPLRRRSWRRHADTSGSRTAALLRDDVWVSDEVLAHQVDYYRRRAGEYDVTAYGDVAAARARIARLVTQMRPTGRVLEIACGTGLWTQALAGLADMVTAIDAAPEVVEIARDRVRSANVSFEVVDVFSWDPDARFDVIFFSAWLSHVPMSRLGQFWYWLRGLLAEDGRVLFIDEHVDEREKEAYVPGRDEIVERQLRDGSTFRVIKNFVDPDRLELRLRRLGWDCAIRRDGRDWVCGEACLAR